MRDSHVKQFAGLLFGIGSVAFPVVALNFGRDSSNSILFFIGIIIGAFFAIVGIILSAISLKQAGDNGDNKAKGMIGLITSIVSIASCLFLFFIIGLAILIAGKM